jgi:hypothetical protein
MTTMTRIAVPTPRKDDATVGSVPWSRMGWVIWRQHRTALIGLLAFIGALAVGFLIIGLQLHHAYAAASACHRANSAACNGLVTNFNRIGNFLSNGLPLQVVAPLIGAFVGAPLLAREFEVGTFRFTFTQGFGRWRWTLAKLTGLGVVVAATSGALSVMTSWYYQPYFASGSQSLSKPSLSLTQRNPLDAGLFDVRGIDLAAWTLAAFAVGALAGVLIRRVVPTIVATLTVYAGFAFAAGGWLRMHYLTPLVTKGLNVPGSAVTVSQWATRGGRVVFAGPPTYPIYQQYCPAAAGAGKGGGGSSSGNPLECMIQHGFTFWSSYQPASRFWPFQWIEGGLLLALSLLLIAATVWLVRRRAA